MDILIQISEDSSILENLRNEAQESSCEQGKFLKALELFNEFLENSLHGPEEQSKRTGPILEEKAIAVILAKYYTNFIES